jgi:hypothetical protein
VGLAGFLGLALLGPGAAMAATVVNGDFETGNLNGWTMVDEGAPGGWYAYSGTHIAPFGPCCETEVPAPPQGSYAAIAAQEEEGMRILYQDIALEPGTNLTLSMLVYYRSQAALVTPDPETLDYTGGPNEQYRIDVMKPSAPLASVEPEDILATVFQTKSGDPEEMPATKFSVDLSQFAGQTVRLRVAEADNLGVLAAGIDSVSFPQPPPVPPSNSFSVGKPQLNKKSGTAKVPVFVPGAGALSAGPASAGKTPKLKTATVSPTTSGNVFPVLKPTAAGRKVLKAKGKLRVKVLFTFTPTGGTAAAQTRTVVLKLNKPKPKK